VQFPEKGLVFDYFVDEQQCLMVPWDERVPKFTYMPDNFTNMFVPTVETTRLTYFLDSLVANKHYAMFVGNTGTGKTAIMMNKLKSMDSETMSYYTINMNSFSDAPSLQVRCLLNWLPAWAVPVRCMVLLTELDHTACDHALVLAAARLPHHVPVAGGPTHEPIAAASLVAAPVQQARL
jgi:hypothetical protein